VGIFDGTDTIINAHLLADGTCELRHKGAPQVLSGKSRICPDAAALVRDLYERIEETWLASTRRLTKQASKENWRFTTESAIDPNNTSREKQVEKRISQLAEVGKLDADRWANQIPVASGLLGTHTDKKACVDLAFRLGKHSFDLIELKMSSSAGHTLFAMMEVLRYGVMYLFSRRHARELGYVIGGSGLLGAEQIRLLVLVPETYFSETPGPWLRTLCNELTAGLAAELARERPERLAMQIDCEHFPSFFQWPSGDEELMRAVRERKSVFHASRS
jgi:hypothetical protein